MSLDLTVLTSAAASLSEALLLLNEGQPTAVRLAIRDGAIQRFEYCYELAVKFIKRALKDRSAVPDSIESLSFQTVMREAATGGLIDDPAAWMDFREARNRTSHSYDSRTAEEVAATIPTFQVALAGLIASLSRPP